MKTVRFERHGRIEEGTWHEGQILDRQGLVVPDAPLLPPVEPRQVLGLALNYREHAAELDLAEPEDPVLFFKPLTTVIGHQSPIIFPHGAQYCHYETELAVVMGHRGRKISESAAWDYILGFTIANDFTCRDFIRNTFRPPVKAKGFDTFLPLGPCLVGRDEFSNPLQLTLRTEVNGQLKQEGNTRFLTLSIPQIIAYVSDFMTLHPYDVILTGTPPGISPVHPGDIIRCAVGGIGTLENPVIAESEPHYGDAKEGK